MLNPSRPFNFMKQLEAKLVDKVCPHLRNIPGRCRAAMNAPCHLTAQHLLWVRGWQLANAFDDESLLGAKDFHCLGDEMITLAKHTVGETFAFPKRKPILYYFDHPRPKYWPSFLGKQRYQLGATQQTCAGWQFSCFSGLPNGPHQVPLIFPKTQVSETF